MSQLLYQYIEYTKVAHLEDLFSLYNVPNAIVA